MREGFPRYPRGAGAATMPAMTASRPALDHPRTGERVRWHLTAADTGGALARAEFRVPVGGRLGVRYLDATAEERVQVLAGTLTGRVGGRTVTLGPGDSCTAPAGDGRRWANAGDVELRLMLEVAPAGGFEQAVDAHFDQETL